MRESSQLNMDMISDLPEDVLLQLLSFLPIQEIISTTRLSKRWKNLWKLIPKLSFDDRNVKRFGRDYTRFIYFVEKSMLSHEAPVLTTFKLQLSRSCSTEQIALWIRLAVYRNVRNLTIKLHSRHGQVRLPRNLCISKSLVVLKLKNAILQDIPTSSYFKSLKTLHLKYLVFSGDESLRRLISSCPSLQNLVVKRDLRDNVKRFEIKVRYLQSLRVSMLSSDETTEPESDDYVIESDEYVIDTPNLKSLKIQDYFTDICSFQEMNQLEEANLETEFTCSKEFIKSLRFSKKLSLCLRNLKVRYFKDVIFSRLNTLEICTCDDENWLKLLMCLLNASPDLRVLKLQMNGDCQKTNWLYVWDEPNYVPECLSKTLESFEYREYDGKANDRKLFKYILKNAIKVKMAMIVPITEFSLEISRSIEEDLQSFCTLISDPVNLDNNLTSYLYVRFL